MNRSVQFTQSKADQALLPAVEAALANRDYKSFSDLCKQALRQLLLSSPEVAAHAPDRSPATPDRHTIDPHTIDPHTIDPHTIDPHTTALQQQVIDLQIKLARLEGMMEASQSASLGLLEQRLGGLIERVDRLEMGRGRGGEVRENREGEEDREDREDGRDREEREEQEEADPLLSRLAPLLEDF